MASVCSGTLALLDAGVPLKASAAGVAMGIITGTKYVIVKIILFYYIVSCLLMLF